MKKYAVFFLLFFLACLGFGAYRSLKIDLDKKGAASDKLTVILTGFGSVSMLGKASGEIAPFYNVLENPKNLKDEISMCDLGIEGKIYQETVIIASTGMAKVRTTACLLDILENYKGRLKEVIFVGIAGITPMKGGLVDWDGKVRASERAMLGDVCINSLAFDLDLQHYSSDLAGVSGKVPYFWPQESSFKSQYTKNDSKLADELYTASGEINWQETPGKVKEINFLYHGENRKPKVWSTKECLEATSDMYWTDIEMDRKAREIGASFMSGSGRRVSADEILIATSMEASPVGAVINWWNAGENENIQWAYVRGAGNFDQVYPDKNGLPAIDGNTAIERFRNSGGSDFAIMTASLPVLKMLELRNQKN